MQDITNEEGQFFRLQRGQTSSRTQFGAKYNTRLQLDFSVSQDVVIINRNIYNTFMLLGDVGGLSGLLYAVGAYIVSFLTYNNPENTLA